MRRCTYTIHLVDPFELEKLHFTSLELLADGLIHFKSDDDTRWFSDEFIAGIKSEIPKAKEHADGTRFLVAAARGATLHAPIRMLRSRILAGAGFAAAASASALSPRSSALSIDLDEGTARSVSSAIRAALDSSKPAIVAHWQSKQGEHEWLEDVLGDFGIKGEVKGINPGPVVTLFEVEPARGMVTGAERLRFHYDAIDVIPSGVPVNILLYPMEGDYQASIAYWLLAYRTGGSFMSISKDWP